MDKRRKWIAVLLEEGLQVGVLAPDDVLRHTTPSVLATDLPPGLVAEVLQAGLDNSGFDPQLVVKTLGPEQMAQHLPLPVLWNCLNEVAEAIIREHPLSKSSPVSTGSSEHKVLEPGDIVAEEMSTEDMPEIEVLED